MVKSQVKEELSTAHLPNIHYDIINVIVRVAFILVHVRWCAVIHKKIMSSRYPKTSLKRKQELEKFEQRCFHAMLFCLVEGRNIQDIDINHQIVATKQ